MTVAAARWLRIDRQSWTRLAATGTVGSAVMVTMGAYAIFVFDRFGVQSFLLPRASIRMLLIGLYGWLWLSGSAWFIARRFSGVEAAFDQVFKLYGYAHLPLLLLALAIQIVSVGLELLGPVLIVTLFVILFWFPALLVGATRSAFGFDTRSALLTVAIPYGVWVVVVGGQLRDHVGHLL